MDLILSLLAGALALRLMILVGRFLKRSGAMPLVGEAYLLAIGTPRDHHARHHRQPEN